MIAICSGYSKFHSLSICYVSSSNVAIPTTVCIEQLTYVLVCCLFVTRMVCLCVHTVVCDPPCVNGACVANDTCNCATGFQGERCTEQGTLVHAAQVISHTDTGFGGNLTDYKRIMLHAFLDHQYNPIYSICT